MRLAKNARSRASAATSCAELPRRLVLTCSEETLAISFPGRLLRNQRLFVLNAFGAARRRKSDSVFRINTPRVRNQRLFVLNAFGAARRRKSDSVFRINTPRVRNQRLFVLNAFGAARRRKSDSVFRINTPRVRYVRLLASQINLCPNSHKSCSESHRSRLVRPLTSAHIRGSG
jgi:hypothetical protein